MECCLGATKGNCCHGDADHFPCKAMCSEFIAAVEILVTGCNALKCFWGCCHDAALLCRCCVEIPMLKLGQLPFFSFFWSRTICPSVCCQAMIGAARLVEDSMHLGSAEQGPWWLMGKALLMLATS
ncbi:hypothetical protein Nepgr_016351 [Nepenthes gracilis]|uniref:Uncharacterized protein n=1 Tax=Nepenthes gracilis TaxID=150966 RepID=A0AAD3SMJ2_NEPGR|nr:hypothetical protein Nepgr_016351 [Nepenthes gracilis]